MTTTHYIWMGIVAVLLVVFTVLSRTDPHRWSNSPDCSRSTPSKVTAGIIAALFSAAVIIGETLF